MPTLALCDPELTLDLPARLTAGSGATVIAQCVEACLSTDFDPLAEAAARAGLERAAAHLAPAVRDGHNVESRAQLMAASLLSGVAVRRGQGAGQSLSCALASVAGVYHGIANAVLLPHVVRYNREHVSGDAIRGVALSLGVAPAESAPETADRVAEALAALFAEAGLPSQLHQANVNHALLPTVAGLAMQDAGHRRSPRPLTQADAEAILTEAL